MRTVCSFVTYFPDFEYHASLGKTPYEWHGGKWKGSISSDGGCFFGLHVKGSEFQTLSVQVRIT